MKKLNKKALTYTALGSASVLTIALTTNLLAPENSFGEALRFSTPILTGLISGALIFYKLKQEANINFNKLEEQE
ncbi:MAG: hypothetical protein BRC30_02400 [Nanohaloarchaea archaeon SW_7_46_7]|nr:MAG: hypothetical protein BRC30_02400 [Nanohaloarchaea archaeon SW_7_46_7]